MSAKIILKSGKEQSIKRLHPWIFSGAIKQIQGAPREGDLVSVYDNQGDFLAWGHYQPSSIAVRILTFENRIPDVNFFKERISNAIEYRRRLGFFDNADTNVFRLVHGEGDGLSGLVVDYYNGTIVFQAHSVGMYLMKDAIAQILIDILGDKVQSIYDKSSQTLPFKADIVPTDGYLFGQYCSNEVVEHGRKFEVDWEKVQSPEYSEKFTDINYAGDDLASHTLDIYLPKVQKDKYPVVVHIYGSAWFSNSSKGMADINTIDDDPVDNVTLDGWYDASMFGYVFQATLTAERGDEVLTAGFYAFNTAYAMVSGAFMQLAGIALTVAQIKPTLDMVKPIMEAVPEVSEGKKVLERISGGIELSHVSFRYDESMNNVIDDLSLKIRAGEYLAIVGSTGCGKSTLLRLMLGFEKPQKGSIFYDRYDLNRVDLQSLRRKIGVVMQDSGLFQGDIYSNIVIAAPQLGMKEAWEAAEIASVAEDIRQMPMGMNTLISEGQGGISGGQRQRIGIARALAVKLRKTDDGIARPPAARRRTGSVPLPGHHRMRIRRRPLRIGRRMRRTVRHTRTEHAAPVPAIRTKAVVNDRRVERSGNRREKNHGGSPCLCYSHHSSFPALLRKFQR